MKKTVRYWIFLIGFVVLTFPASPLYAQTCDSNADCPAGSKCQETFLNTDETCTADSYCKTYPNGDCSGGYASPKGMITSGKCVYKNKECVTAQGTGQSCLKDTDCSASANQTCVGVSVTGSLPPKTTPGKCQLKAGQPPAEFKWQPIAPKLQINIPDWKPFTPADIEKLKQVDEEGNIYIPFIGQYIAAVYSWAVGIAGLVAVVLIIIGGFIYMTAGGNAQRAQEGRERITHAVFGLLLLLGSYFLLYLINPELVKFKSLKIKLIEREILTPGEETSDIVYHGESAGIECFLKNFGKDENEVRQNLRMVDFLNKQYQVHKKMEAALLNASKEIASTGYQIKDGAAFNWRPNVNNPKKLSLHSFGVAFDINPEKNPNKKRPPGQQCDKAPCTNPCETDIPQTIIDALIKNGFRWGGHFRKTCDAMHFEWLGPCSKTGATSQTSPASSPQSQTAPTGCCTYYDKLPEETTAMDCSGFGTWKPGSCY